MFKSEPSARIGWREWIKLPELTSSPIKVKIDTGARTSALHAYHQQRFERDGAPWVRFELHPEQRSKEGLIICEAPVLDQRQVRSSGGHTQDRYVIRTPVQLGEHLWPIEMTLTRRDAMGFRMLLGRTALRRRFLVDSSASYLHGRQPRKTRRPRS